VTPPELPTQQGPLKAAPGARKRRAEDNDHQGRNQEEEPAAAATPRGKRRRAGAPAAAGEGGARRVEGQGAGAGSPDPAFGAPAEAGMPAWMAAGATPMDGAFAPAASDGDSPERPTALAPRAVAVPQRPQPAGGRQTPGSGGRLGKMQAASPATHRTYERPGSVTPHGKDQDKEAPAPAKGRVRGGEGHGTWAARGLRAVWLQLPEFQRNLAQMWHCAALTHGPYLLPLPLPGRQLQLRARRHRAHWPPWCAGALPARAGARL
jgi:hypothetical protein